VWLYLMHLKNALMSRSFDVYMYFLVGISFAVDGLSVGGIVAVWLLLDPCLLLEEAFFLILSSTSVNECVLLAVDGVAALDAGCSSSSESSDPLASLSLSSLCLDVFVELFFLFLEEVFFVMLLFGEKSLVAPTGRYTAGKPPTGGLTAKS